jgi:hypothetical protein
LTFIFVFIWADLSPEKGQRGKRVNFFCKFLLYKERERIRIHTEVLRGFLRRGITHGFIMAYFGFLCKGFLGKFVKFGGNRHGEWGVGNREWGLCP